jgi:formylglycine-generating enzyme required for sulfatase activity
VSNRKHRYACKAAEASVCAQDQGLFWSFHDLTFKNQHKLKPDNLRAYAEAAGADLAQFDSCMKSGAGKARVVADAEHGKAVETHGTPRIWVDGTLYRSGSSAEQMARAIELALGTSATEAAQKAQAMRVERPHHDPIPADVASMQPVSHDGLSFQIDTFEASLADGKAAVGKHQIPATNMSWFAARDACEAAGKRLCTEEEWVTACQGARAIDDNKDGGFADDMVEGVTYPYGDYHNRGHCWDGRNPQTDRPVYTGEMPGCKSSDGAYDMTGNVEEWVGDTPETATLVGGSYDTSKDFARCYRRNAVFGPGYANKRTGFRSCAGASEAN